MAKVLKAANTAVELKGANTTVEGVFLAQDVVNELIEEAEGLLRLHKNMQPLPEDIARQLLGAYKK